MRLPNVGRVLVEAFDTHVHPRIAVTQNRCRADSRANEGAAAAEQGPMGGDCGRRTRVPRSQWSRLRGLR